MPRLDEPLIPPKVIPRERYLYLVESADRARGEYVVAHDAREARRVALETKAGTPADRVTRRQRIPHGSRYPYPGPSI